MKFGIWITLNSFISWFNLFDSGLANGLRNLLTEQFSNKSFSKARAYVSTTYLGLILISTILFISFILISLFVEWTYVFNVSIADVSENELKELVTVTLVFFLIRFVIQTIGTIYVASQSYYINDLLAFSSSFVSFVGMLILVQFSQGDLLSTSYVLSGLPLLVFIVATYIGFRSRFYTIRPSINFVNKEVTRELFGKGVGFFLLQISAVVIFSTDNLLIAQLLGPPEVASYNVVFKYFSVVSIAFSAVVGPFWSAATQAFSQNDFYWIRKSIKRLLIIWFALVILTIMFYFCADKFYLFWIGESVKISKILNVLMGLFVVITSWNGLFAAFLNGIGKIKLQIFYSVFAMAINIPLSVFIVRNTDLGSSGIILATSISLLIGSVLAPIQVMKITSGKASGFWNK